MGKKSLTQSTTKKKSTSKKKNTAKTGSKSAAASSKSAAKKKSGSRKPTLKSLRKKDFGTWAPETLYAPEPEPGRFEAPPAVDAKDTETAGNLRALLKKRFEPLTAESKAPAKKKKKKAAEASGKKAAPAKPPASREDLLKRAFPAWTPAALFQPEPEPGRFEAPLIAENAGSPEFREILFREFDLSKVIPKPPQEPPETAAEPVEPEHEQSISQPEEIETALEEPGEPHGEEAAAAASMEAEEEEEAPAGAEAENPKAEQQKPEQPQPEKRARPADTRSNTPETPKGPPGKGGGEPPGPPPPPPPGGPQEPSPEPMSRSLKMLIIGVAAVFACLIIASALNSGKYYVTATSSGVEIWKGDFSPQGREKVIELEGMAPPEGLEGRVSRQEAYSLPFDYYITKARKLSEKTGVPDYGAIREKLEKAREYAVSAKQLRQVKDRLNHIEFTLLLNRADLAAAKETPEGYGKALEHLREARRHALTPSERELVAKKIRSLQKKQKKAGSESPGTEAQPEKGKKKAPGREGPPPDEKETLT
jgi:hypothetical protein